MEKYFHEICRRYRLEESILIKKAYLYAKEKCNSMTRNSGENVIFHPLRMLDNALLADDLLDKTELFITGLLHDIIEDCNITKEELGKEFSEQIAENVSLLSKPYIPEEAFENMDKEKKRAIINKRNNDYLQGIFASNNPIIKLVKTCDRLDNLETFDALLGRLKLKSLRKFIEESRYMHEQCRQFNPALEKKFAAALKNAEKLMKEQETKK